MMRADLTIRLTVCGRCFARGVPPYSRNRLTLHRSTLTVHRRIRLVFGRTKWSAGCSVPLDAVVPLRDVLAMGVPE